jgi:hypothetical protein
MACDDRFRDGIFVCDLGKVVGRDLTMGEGYIELILRSGRVSQDFSGSATVTAAAAAFVFSPFARKKNRK